MQARPQAPVRKVLLQFDPDHPDLEDLRGEISSNAIAGPNLWVSHDEGAGIERLTWNGDRYTEHHQFLLTDFFDLPAGQDEVDMEGLAYEAPYLWFCGSMSLKTRYPRR